MSTVFAILVIYAIIVEQDAGKLLLAGFIPGMFSAVIHAALIVGMALVFGNSGPPRRRLFIAPALRRAAVMALNGHREYGQGPERRRIRRTSRGERRAGYLRPGGRGVDFLYLRGHIGYALSMLTLPQIEAAAPDQASLKAATKLMKAAKWPVRAIHESTGLIWGECQGSGANPYRVTADRNDLGTKCTCPSRKFPCKHALALMWMYAEGPQGFAPGDVPEWVADWVGRRRKSTPRTTPEPSRADTKSIAGAAMPKEEDAPDEKTLARRRAGAEKRRAALLSGVEAATHDLERWIGDQLRAGLPAFLNEATDRCRRIAARMVDAKAQALAGRIDEMPARLMVLRPEERADAAIAELGRLVLLVRAWRAAPDDPELFRAVIASETREQIFEAEDAPAVASCWEVLNERVTTRRDGLVSQTTWLLNLAPEGNAPDFAQLLDFFPASAGRRTASFRAGEQFRAALRYYPARHPLRALIAERGAIEAPLPWPRAVVEGHPLDRLHALRDAAPWTTAAPLLLPPGRLGEAEGRTWWRAQAGAAMLPLAQKPDRYAMGTTLSAGIGVWDNGRLDLLAAHSDFGRLGFDA